jgi:D-aminoacyl-tRNA deacylase
MRALIQRVTRAQVAEKGHPVEKLANIGPGMVVLLGFEEGDTLLALEQIVQKIKALRIFPDGEGKMNLPAAEVNGQFLLVSQFTLYADLKYGNRPSFTKAAPKAKAQELYRHFCQTAERLLGADRVRYTAFGSDLEVELVNDGPVTIWLDSTEIL